MPPAVGAAAAAVAFGLFAEATLGVIIVSAVLAASATLLAERLAPETEKLEVRGLRQTIRSPSAPRQMVYGERRVGGVITFAHITRGYIGSDGTFSKNRFFHLAVVFAGHGIDGFADLWLADERVPLEADPEPGSDFEVPTAGSKFHSGAGGTPGRARFLGVTKQLGTAGQAADSEMVKIEAELDTEFGATATGALWDVNHRLNGLAYLYLRLGHDTTKYQTGVPEISATVRGKKLYDPRTASTVWSDNPALALRDYLTDAVHGVGIPSAQVSDAETIAAANICDEQVALTARAAVFTADPATDLLSLAADAESPRLRRGMVCRVATDGSLPPPLLAATDYFAVPLDAATWGLAADLAAARAGALIVITGAGSGTHTLTVMSELRYTANMAFDATVSHQDVILGLVKGMAGRLVFSGGQWLIRAGAWSPGTVTLDEGDLRGPVQVQPRRPRRELFNAVKGLYLDRDAGWIEKTYPAVTNGFYQDQDNGERLWRELDLPASDSPSMAQRIAKIELERSRQQISAVLQCTLAALDVVAAETVLIDNAQLGWSAKAFEVADWSLVNVEAAGGPALGIDLVLRETAAGVFDWNAGEETAADLAQDTSIGSPFDLEPPGAPAVAETLYLSRPEVLKVKAVLTWPAALDDLVDQYQVEWKPSGASDWQPGGLVPAALMTVDILDLTAGSYDFRVRSLNQASGGVSVWAETLNQALAGLSAAPAALAEVTLTAMGGLALLRWTRSADLDVVVGGRIDFRHAPSQTATDFAASASIGKPVPGDQIEAVLPLKAGTYFLRAVDSSGNAGAVAKVATKDATVLTYSSLGQVIEQPGFAGTKTNVVALDGKLKLEGNTLIDSVADWDADIDDLDGLGGIATGAPQAGIYGFDAGLDLGSVKKVRLTGTIDALVFNVFALMDDRAEPIDSWESFDETVPHGVADALLYARHTDDDPAGSPTWSDWTRLDAGEFEARGFEFRLDLSNSDSSFNIEISQLEVIAEEVV